MSLNLRMPENIILKPCITVFGVGGAGGNAVNNMINSKLEGARFVVANTDAQALEYSLADRKIQLGENITRGLGAGAAPEVGKASADEAMADIMEHLNGSNMVFITAGMGGGTGTGAAPVIAKAAKENGILTVGVVTKPFHFEGSHRMKIAELGLQELQKYVDTLIVIPNQNLFRIANEKTTFADAFKMADDVLHAGVRGVTDLMIMPGLINLDFADIRTVMSEMGKAMMGTGESENENRAIKAAEAAISNPLLDHSSMKGARGVLINITGGSDMTLYEVDEAANRIREEVDQDANIIFGSTYNPNLDGKIRVSVVATGIDIANSSAENKTIRSFLNNKEQEIHDLKTQHKTLRDDVNIQDDPENNDLNDELFIDINELASIIQENNSENLQSSVSMHKPDVYNKPQQQRSPGLFERVASSVGLIKKTNHNKQDADYALYREDKLSTENYNTANKQPSFGNETLEIPAFLRRKK